jgi:hypothetical protein
LLGQPAEVIFPFDSLGQLMCVLENVSARVFELSRMAEDVKRRVAWAKTSALLSREWWGVADDQFQMGHGAVINGGPGVGAADHRRSYIRCSPKPALLRRRLRTPSRSAEGHAIGRRLCRR